MPSKDLGVVGSRHGGAEYDVGMACEHLGGRMQHDVGTRFQRSLQQRSREGALSTTKQRFGVRDTGPSVGRSATSMVGLVGDSIHTTSAPSAAARTSLVSATLTRRTCQPYLWARRSMACATPR